MPGVLFLNYLLRQLLFLAVNKQLEHFSAMNQKIKMIIFPHFYFRNRL